MLFPDDSEEKHVEQGLNAIDDLFEGLNMIKELSESVEQLIGVISNLPVTNHAI